MCAMKYIGILFLLFWNSVGADTRTNVFRRRDAATLTTSSGRWISETRILQPVSILIRSFVLTIGPTANPLVQFQIDEIGEAIESLISEKLKSSDDESLSRINNVDMSGVSHTVHTPAIQISQWKTKMSRTELHFNGGVAQTEISENSNAQTQIPSRNDLSHAVKSILEEFLLNKLRSDVDGLEWLTLLTVESAIPETDFPSASPTQHPTIKPTRRPTRKPTEEPTLIPSLSPTKEPTAKPSPGPTPKPSPEPTSKQIFPEPTLTTTITPTGYHDKAPVPEPTPHPIMIQTPAPVGDGDGDATDDSEVDDEPIDNNGNNTNNSEDANSINIIAASAGSGSALVLVFIFAAFLKRRKEKYNKYLVPVPSHESEHDDGGAYGTRTLRKRGNSDGDSTKSPDSIERKIAPMDTQPCYDTTHLQNQNKGFDESPPASEILNDLQLTDIEAAPAIVDAESDQIKEGKHVSFPVKINFTHEIPFEDDAYKGDDDDVSSPKKGDGSVSTCTLTAPMDRDEESFELKSMDLSPGRKDFSQTADWFQEDNEFNTTFEDQQCYLTPKTFPAVSNLETITEPDHSKPALTEEGVPSPDTEDVPKPKEIRKKVRRNRSKSRSLSRKRSTSRARSRSRTSSGSASESEVSEFLIDSSWDPDDAEAESDAPSFDDPQFEPLFEPDSQLDFKYEDHLTPAETHEFS